MYFKIRHIGGYHTQIAYILELTINADNTRITEEVTMSNGLVHTNLIENLQDIIKEFKEHNKQVMRERRKKQTKEN